MKNARLRAVLVDIDGTLIDSNDAHVRAWMKVLARHGHEFPYDAIRPLIGQGGDKLLERLLGGDGKSPAAQALAAERREAFLADELHALQPTRGARDLLERLRAARLQVVVATAANGGETQALLRQAGLDDLVDAAASSADVDASKPDPDVVQAATRRAGVRPSEVVMLGDTPHDVDAAWKAGTGTIALRCGGWWNDDAFARALAIYDDPAALLEGLGSSPIGERL
jgi:HAD superfamily hydrolase (TIGR01509 family)